MIFGSWILLIAAGAAASRPTVVKIQSKDLDIVEKEVGKSAEEMTEEELKGGMKKLGIQEGKLTSEDRRVINIEVKFCPECGSSLELDYVFCPYCGHKE
ncbi:MAG: zinc-ribbon domain-containing protein [Candidatus Hodarchaeota archaeon]